MFTTCVTKQGQAGGESIELAFIHYYDSPAANDWRLSHGLDVKRPLGDI